MFSFFFVDDFRIVLGCRKVRVYGIFLSRIFFYLLISIYNILLCFNLKFGFFFLCVFSGFDGV